MKKIIFAFTLLFSLSTNALLSPQEEIRIPERGITTGVGFNPSDLSQLRQNYVSDLPCPLCQSVKDSTLIDEHFSQIFGPDWNKSKKSNAVD